MIDPEEKPEKPTVKERTPKKRIASDPFPHLRKPAQLSPVEEIMGLFPAPGHPVEQDLLARPLENTQEADKEQNNPANLIPKPTPPTPPTADTPPTSRTPPTSSIAPERDFARVANSIVREGVAGGFFVGKSKQIYDFLYSLTRGSIVPKRSVTISKPALMRGADIGSERTLLKNLTHLKGVRLLEIAYTDGKHEGNEYTVHMPEEVGLKATILKRTPPTPPTDATPRHARTEVPPVPPAESGVGDVGLGVVESTTSGESKTSFKTSTERSDDDEAFAKFICVLKQATREVTGKEPSAAEAGRWGEVAEVLVTELRIAAARTTVSSAPSFFAEHLRRRLFKKDKRQLAEEAAAQPARPALPASVDVNSCPDCRGSNYFYPEGYEKGVRRCGHERLLKPE